MNQSPIAGIAKAAAQRVRKHSLLAKSVIAVIDFFTPRQPTFDLKTGEEVLAQIAASHSGGGGLGGALYTPLVVTNQRLLWKPSPEGLARLFEREVEVPLERLASVDKGLPRDWLRFRFDTRIGIILKSGKRMVFSVSYRHEVEFGNFLACIRSSIPGAGV
jgi:hypothetical protein